MTRSTYTHALTHTHIHVHTQEHIVRCVNIIEGTVWDLRVWTFDNPEDPTGCLLHAWTESINLPLSMELSINSTRFSSKMEKKNKKKNKETFLTRSFLCIGWFMVLLLCFLVDFREQGELCSSNTEENPFHHSTVLLLYWWTLHPEPPVLPLSLSLFLFLSLLFFSHCISRWFTGTSLVISGRSDGSVRRKYGQWLMA